MEYSRILLFLKKKCPSIEHDLPYWAPEIVPMKIYQITGVNITRLTDKNFIGNDDSDYNVSVYDFVVKNYLMLYLYSRIESLASSCGKENKFILK